MVCLDPDPGESASFGRIRIRTVSIATNSIPEQYSFLENFKVLAKILEIMTPMAEKRKKTVFTGSAVNQSFFFLSDFPSCVKLG